MSDNDTGETIRHAAPTRRDYVKYGGAVVGGGLLAGCAGDSSSDRVETDTSTPTETTREETETPEDTSYSVTMEPVGTVEFDAVPEEMAISSRCRSTTCS